MNNVQQLNAFILSQIVWSGVCGGREGSLTMISSNKQYAILLIIYIFVCVFSGYMRSNVTGVLDGQACAHTHTHTHTHVCTHWLCDTGCKRSMLCDTRCSVIPGARGPCSVIPGARGPCSVIPGARGPCSVILGAL